MKFLFLISFVLVSCNQDKPSVKVTVNESEEIVVIEREVEIENDEDLKPEIEVVQGDYDHDGKKIITAPTRNLKLYPNGVYRDYNKTCDVYIGSGGVKVICTLGPCQKYETLYLQSWYATIWKANRDGRKRLGREQRVTFRRQQKWEKCLYKFGTSYQVDFSGGEKL